MKAKRSKTVSVRRKKGKGGKGKEQQQIATCIPIATRHDSWLETCPAADYDDSHNINTISYLPGSKAAVKLEIRQLDDQLPTERPTCLP